jgi:PST family polysaccharide transporter
MADTQPAPDNSLSKRAVRGAAWTLPTSLASRVIGLVGTLLLAKFLLPAEYGEVSAASIIILTASSVTTFGVGTYLVSNRDLSREETFHATTWFVGTGVLALAAVLPMQHWFARWFDAPSVGRYLPILALTSLIERVNFLPERMLVRHLRFRWLSIARTLGELTYTGVSVGLAAYGMGAMAIVWANLARTVVRSLSIVPAVDRREWLEFHRLHWATMKKLVGYGLNVSLASVATFAMRRWDNLMISRYFGPAVMGAYNYAYNLADTPAVAVGEQMSDVVSAAFPHVEQEKRAAALVRACTLISVIMFPLAFGLSAVAPTVVNTFFPAKWQSVGSMLVFLSVLSAPRPLANILTSYFYACNRPRVVLWLEWLSLVLLVVSLATIGRLGINWACVAVGATFLLRTLAAMLAVRQADGVSLGKFLLPLVRPIIACVLMVAAILAVRPLLSGLRPAVQLAIEVAVGGVVYVGGALVIARAATRDLLQMVRSALLRR